MAEQDTSKSTPAPYKGGQGRLQALNLQLAGSNLAGGGSGAQDKLRPLFAGVRSGIEGEAMRSEFQSNMTQLNREQDTSSRALRERVRQETNEIEDNASPGEIVALTVQGVIVAEQLASSVADSMQTDVDKSSSETIQEEYVDSDGVTRIKEVTKDIPYTSKEDTGLIGKGLRGFSRGVQRLIPGVGSKRAGQREDDEADIRDDIANKVIEASVNLQAGQELERIAKREESAAERNRLFAEAHGASLSNIADLIKGISERNGDADISGAASRYNNLLDTEDPLPGTGSPPFRNNSQSPLLPSSHGTPRKSGYGEIEFSEATGSGEIDLVQMKGITDKIAEGESGGSYNAMNQGATKDTGIVGSTANSVTVIGKELTNMTIGDIEKQMALPFGDPNRIGAAGKHQWITHPRGDFQKAVKAAGLNNTDIFSPENQERMVQSYILGLSSLKNYRSGKGTSDEFIDQISGKWLSVKDSKGQGKDDGINKATTDFAPLHDQIKKAFLPNMR